MSDLVVCSWPIDKPIPYARNSRKIPERAIDKVAASIKELFRNNSPDVPGRNVPAATLTGAAVSDSPCV